MNYMGLSFQAALKKYTCLSLPTIQVSRPKQINKTDIDKFMADRQAVMHYLLTCHQAYNKPLNRRLKLWWIKQEPARSIYAITEAEL